jgi:Tol biopolymer transport system component
VGVPAIFLMDADGSNPRPLVKIPGMKWHGSPAWSHDGTMIAFDATAVGHEGAHVLVYAVSGPFKGTLKDMGRGNSPDFSPDGSRIAYFLGDNARPDERPGIYVMNSDGTGRRWLAAGERPKWSPDGKKVTTAVRVPRRAAVDVVEVDTGRITRVLDSKYALIPGASWSPDGKQIVFIGYIDEPRTAAELVVVPADATPAAPDGPLPAAEVRRVLVRGWIGWHPNWSPDGKLITFVHWEMIEGVRVQTNYVVAADGKGQPVKLKNQDAGSRNVEVDWSPDGKTIVFGSDREVDGQVSVERTDALRVDIRADEQ